ncbi:MAG TPA: sulfatase, partial [Phycisphaerae bacterium]|nr:sulfatase [Phycisphaerae bacterium]
FNHTNGQYGLAHAAHNFHCRPGVKSLPNLLSKAGYRTAIVGKHHVNPPEAFAFQEQLRFQGGSRNVDAMADAARGLFAGSSDRPFFLLVGFHDPHRDAKGFGNSVSRPAGTVAEYQPEEIAVPPWLPDTPEVRRELAEFYQSISRMDRGVSLIVDALKDTGHENDTLVIYVSDNGPPFPGAKTTLYDPGIHLPLIIASPGQSRRGITSQAMVSFVDIAPTILEFAGVAPSKEVARRSLLPIIDEENPAGRDIVFASHNFHQVTMYYPMRMIRTRQYKYILNLAHCLEYPLASDLWGSRTWQGILSSGGKRYGQRTTAALLHRPREELYDLRKDPDEVHNLAGDPGHADTLARFRAELQKWQEDTADPWLIKYTHE